MPSLSDHIEHLTTTARAIRASATAIIPSEDNPSAQIGPFTRAVLDTALGDLIRDIDTSELGLFTLIPATNADVRKQPENGARRGEISRAGFPGATPLRKIPTRRNEVLKPKEFEPDVYARAALKYLDRYQSIRPMPRARAQVIALIEQLDQVRASIKHLNETVEELTSFALATAPETQISSVAEEEERIDGLQNRLAELRLQKESLLQANDLQPRNKSSISCSQSKPPHPRPSATESDPHEEAFWFTPATSARTLRFSEKLMDEDVDFGDVSTISFDSPGPVAPRSVFASLATGRNLDDDDIDIAPTADSVHQQGDVSDEQGEGAPFNGENEEEYVSRQVDISEDEDEEQTVVLRKVAPSPPSQLPDDPPPPTSGTHSGSNEPLVDIQSTTEQAMKASKMRITPELERIVAKIWCTVGEIIMPGNSYLKDVKPPRAKETLARIELLAAQSPSPQSPSSHSLSSFTSSSSSGVATGPTPHQINTAQFLHVLLTAPNHAMQLNKLKTAIGGTRALYACVAKKLVRIDRGEAEQIVLFDV